MKTFEGSTMSIRVRAATALTAALVAVSATAQIIVPGTADPYLAGMPDGSTAKGGDTVPAQSPVLVQLRDFAAGDQLTFSATGATSFAGGTPPANGTRDGDSFFANSEENNISGCTYPLNALIGVFLTGEPPVTSPGGIQEIIEDYDPWRGSGYGFLYYDPSVEPFWDASSARASCSTTRRSGRN
ncbi:MAG: hypothetical protein H0W20_00595 [Chthoniobacterales bacterium]|nr:hypothetical protein [Chthoniobacterales bacterium]